MTVRIAVDDSQMAVKLAVCQMAMDIAVDQGMCVSHIAMEM
jgi:hypothetical protein